MSQEEAENSVVAKLPREGSALDPGMAACRHASSRMFGPRSCQVYHSHLGLEILARRRQVAVEGHTWPVSGLGEIPSPPRFE